MRRSGCRRRAPLSEWLDHRGCRDSGRYEWKRPQSLLRPRVRGATSKPAVSVVRGGLPPYTLSACWARIVVNCCQVNDLKIRQRDAGLFSRRTSTLGSTGRVRRPKTPPRGSGGTGRRTSLRGWRSQERGGSNPPFRTKIDPGGLRPRRTPIRVRSRGPRSPRSAHAGSLDFAHSRCE